MRFSVYCLAFCIEFYNHHLHKSSKKHICIEEKVIIEINFNPGLGLTSFRTILPCFQQVNLTCAWDPIENQHLVSGQLQKKHVTSMSCRLELTIWSHDTGQMSEKYTVNQGCMSLSTYYLEGGCHLAQLRHRRCC